MLSCRHTSCDSTKQGLTSENQTCDGCDGIRECRHTQPETPLNSPEATRPGHAVTRADRDKISADVGRVVVRVPAVPPVLAVPAARVLLAILVELTEVPVLDRPEGRGAR